MKGAIPLPTWPICYERWVELFARESPTTHHVFLAAALGGALGATGRWAVGTLWTITPGAWPWSTLIVNVTGAFLIGLVARRTVVASLKWAFVVTGVLGGFTTFSAFAIELNGMVEADRTQLAVAYGAITLFAGVGAALLAQLGRPTTKVLQ